MLVYQINIYMRCAHLIFPLLMQTVYECDLRIQWIKMHQFPALRNTIFIIVHQFLFTLSRNTQFSISGAQLFFVHFYWCSYSCKSIRKKVCFVWHFSMNIQCKQYENYTIDWNRIQQCYNNSHKRMERLFFSSLSSSSSSSLSSLLSCFCLWNHFRHSFYSHHGCNCFWVRPIITWCSSELI